MDFLSWKYTVQNVWWEITWVWWSVGHEFQIAFTLLSSLIKMSLKTFISKNYVKNESTY